MVRLSTDTQQKLYIERLNSIAERRQRVSTLSIELKLIVNMRL